MCLSLVINTMNLKTVPVYAIKAQGEVEVKTHAFLASVSDKCKWLGGHSICFESGKWLKLNKGLESSRTSLQMNINNM